MPRHAREVYVRRRIAAAVIAVLSLGAVGTLVYTGVALGEPLPAPSVGQATPQVPTGTAADPVLPGYGSVAIGAVGWSKPLATSGTQTPLPIASISKTITALMTLDRMPLAAGEDGPSRTLTADDSALYDAAIADDESAVPLPAGSVITERETLEAMLIASSND